MGFLRIQKSGAILTWTIDRPDRRNALGTTLAQELKGALDQLTGELTAWRDAAARIDPPYRVLVIGATPYVQGDRRTWIAGGDLKELKELTDPTTYAQTMCDVLRGLERLPLPVIMAMDGATIGGGIEFALAGDFRVATRATTFQFKQLQIGLATGYGSARRLLDFVGPAKARELMLFAETLTAEQALELGLVSKVVAGPESLSRAVHEMAEALCKLEPLAIAAQKKMLTSAAMPPQTTLAAELAEFKSLWRNPTHAEFLDEF